MTPSLQSPVTRALILFFFTLAAIGNVFVFSFIASSGNATAISFGMFGVLLNIAVLFNAIGSKPNLNTGSGTDSERDASCEKTRRSRPELDKAPHAVLSGGKWNISPVAFVWRDTHLSSRPVNLRL